MRQRGGFCPQSLLEKAVSELSQEFPSQTGLRCVPASGACSRLAPGLDGSPSGAVQTPLGAEEEEGANEAAPWASVGRGAWALSRDTLFFVK